MIQTLDESYFERDENQPSEGAGATGNSNPNIPKTKLIFIWFAFVNKFKF